MLQAGVPALAAQEVSAKCVDSMADVCGYLITSHGTQLDRLESAESSERQRGMVQVLAAMPTVCTVLHFAELAGQCGRKLGISLQLLKKMSADLNCHGY